MRDVTDAGRTDDKRQTLKIELLSQWKLEAESRKNKFQYLECVSHFWMRLHTGGNEDCQEVFLRILASKDVKSAQTPQKFVLSENDFLKSVLKSGLILNDKRCVCILDPNEK